MSNKQLCEDGDPGCPVCHGDCGNEGRIMVKRIDMDTEKRSFDFCACDKCAEDMSASGVFAFLVDLDKIKP